ncbi:MAG TPA: squalene/phytoene synthase family protein [Anaerolineales bacterium]|nr:squalene/phytoene synthase family protein [Anaerolineales bacterium]
MNTLSPTPFIAASITKAASKQTYYTIRFLVDRDRVVDAYKAYAYFRWVDDTLDGDSVRSAVDTCPGGQCQGAHERLTFLQRQKTLLKKCYRGEIPQDATMEEQMLVELVRRDQEKNSGLQSYLYNMMQVMEFDAKRRGSLISQTELNEYTRWLATAVTEAMHYFIGHCCYSPHTEIRYLAVSGAHITHMLRDTFDDLQAGYYNVPREVLEANHIQPHDTQSKAYRAWVKSRVQLARQYFTAGRAYLARVENPRCRLAGLAYTARFEWLLDTIEREDFSLRPQYDERKSVGTGLRMGLSTLFSIINLRGTETVHQPVVSQSFRKP